MGKILATFSLTSRKRMPVFTVYIQHRDLSWPAQSGKKWLEIIGFLLTNLELHKITIYPAIPLRGISPKEWSGGVSSMYFYATVQSSMINSSQKVHPNVQHQMSECAKCGRSIHGNSVQFKKEWNSDTCCTMGESWRYYPKWNKLDIVGQILNDSFSVRY